MKSFEERIAMLNEAQREAVDHIDGPLLVIAGPGTGKTQLLSLRAANILRQCDVQPGNILCLTYTDAGAQAMRKRLVELIGREAYGIVVSTFHSFASSVKARYPEYFPANDSSFVISSLHADEIIDGLLKSREYNDPLSSVGRDGTAFYLRGMKSFIGNMKRQGIDPETYCKIMEQNIQAASYLESTGLFSIFDQRIPCGVDDKFEYIARFEQAVARACEQAPAVLWKPVVSTPGIYVPYIAWLDRVVNDTQLISESGNTEGFQNIRKTIAEKNDQGCYASKALSASEKGSAAGEVYAAYQARLVEEGFFDFDDMVMECIAAIRDNPELRYALQERYQYIQIDEFQDTNGAQMRIVEFLCEGIESPNVMAVGDDDQAIMRFQGASITCIEQFCALYNPKSVVLKTNYRSTPDIVAFGSQISAQVSKRLSASASDKNIAAFRSQGEQTEFCEKVFLSRELQYQALARDIAARIESGFIGACKDPDEAIAVISPKHSSLAAFIPFLRAENIPFSYKKSTELLEMESMQTLFAMIRFVAAYSSGRKELAQSYIPQIIAAPELGGDGVSSVSFALFAREKYYGEWMQALEATDDARLNAIHAKLLEWSEMAPSAPVRSLVYRIAQDCLHYYAGRKEDDPLALAEFNGGIRAMMDFAETEIEAAKKTDRTIRLAELVERLDRAAFFGESINAAVELGKTGAVQLVSAHGSKGLEYDLVYLLDSDDNTWRKDGGASGLYPGNVLIGDEKDEDDVRRLLFVAITRAKSYLEVYRAGAMPVRELEGIIKTEEIRPDGNELACALETSWHNSYALDTPELRSLVAAALPPRSLSASSLNTFVEYDDGKPGSMAFPQKYILRLPEEPKVFFEFGTIVHSYLENYVIHVVKRGDATADELFKRFHWRISHMDYPEDDVIPYVKRFERIARAFGPWAQTRLEGRLETEVKLSAIVGNNVPLFGFCDLLLIDDAKKTIRVVDYKTGKGYPKGKPDRAYQRQLQFYRLLVENSSDFVGYRVVSCENWYVEPEKGTIETMHEPVISSVSDDDVAYLTQLIDASWGYISAGEFDMLAFEASEIKADALMSLEESGKRITKDMRKNALQEAYERWLIESSCDAMRAC